MLPTQPTYAIEPANDISVLNDPTVACSAASASLLTSAHRHQIVGIREAHANARSEEKNASWITPTFHWTL